MKTTSLAEAKSGIVRWLRSLISPAAKLTATAEISSGLAPNLVPGNGQTILVVDDDTVFLRATTMKLESNGFMVITVKNGADAIKAARRGKPSLMVLDVNLSRDVASGGSVPWDGFRIMSWLRRFDEFKATPVVIASVGDPVQSTRLAIGSGATAFFHKQMNPNQLLTIVKDALSRSRPVREAGLEPNFQI